jgi:subtilisin family serine protease
VPCYLPVLLLLGALTLASSPWTADAGAAPPGDAPYRPGRLIVKYRGLDACASCLLARGEPFAGHTGDPGLDRLHRRLRVRGAAPLFAHASGTERGRSAAYARRLDAVRARFPERAARARLGLAAPDLSQVYVLELPPDADVPAAAAAYARDPRVAYAHPDYEVRADLTPNDPLFPQLYGLQITGAPLAWDAASGAGTVVAVIDTGVDRNHPDLAANMWTNPGEIPNNGIDDDANGFIDDLIGWDFHSGDNDPMDDHGHGTHVAGTAAAVGNNGIGVVGMAFGTRVMAVKGLGQNGSGSTSRLAQGIVYAAENGADVLNNSWGGGGIGGVLVDAVATARALGAVVVAAAGNESGSADFRQPAGIPGVIAVGASDAADAIAGFSNHGEVLSVAAPGVAVLSLRAANAGGLGTSGIVAGQYQLLSGTSMATPHVAGLAAVLLSALPGLTDDEVRWHLELNADQPGYPGFAGAPWNPYFGWGRINAARVFDPPPVTTRLTRLPRTLHAIADTVRPAASFVDVGFTTLGPVAWTITTPAWLAAAPPGGSAPARVVVDVDASGLAPGTVPGPVVVDAPATTDGGGSLDFTLHVHRDERVGEAVALDQDTFLPSGPRVATDGVGSVIVRLEDTILNNRVHRHVLVSHVDGGGTVTGPFAGGGDTAFKLSVGVAFDGRQYLAVWAEDDNRRARVKGFRFAADGEPVDASAFLIAERNVNRSEGIGTVAVGHDGAGFTVVWELLNADTDRSKVYVRRVGDDGSLRGRRAVQIYPDKGKRLVQIISPRLACVPGRCLVAWAEGDGETDATGRFIKKVYGLLLAGDTPVDPAASRLITDASPLSAAASSGSGFALLAQRSERCDAGGFSFAVVAARVSASGVPLDPNGVRLDNQPPGACEVVPAAIDLAFDGAAWVATFLAPAARGPDGSALAHPFGVRLGADGTVLDDEPLGVLLHEEPRPMVDGAFAASRLNGVLAWLEQRLVPLGPFLTTRHELAARRVYALAGEPGYPEVVIGAIGARSVAEGDELLLTVRPPAGLNPATTALAAAGLPPGAAFDAPTGAFRWRPDGTAAGVHAGLTFTADDGLQTASEAVTIVVGESNLSLSGRVRLADGTPVTDAALKIAGVRKEKRVAFTDKDGRYWTGDLVPNSYRVKLDRTSRKRYRLRSPAPRVVVQAADGVAEDVVVEPK